MKLESLEEALRNRLKKLGFELVELKWIPEQGGRTLRVLIDHKQGVTLDDCGTVSRALDDILEDDWGLGSYRLEVSSPGVERPLVRLADYQRFVGKKVSIKAIKPVEGRRNYRGHLVKVIDARIVIESDGTCYELPFENIQKAHLIFEGSN